MASQQKQFTVDHSEIARVLDDVESFTHQMTKWERDFVERIRDDYDRGAVIGPTRKIKLEEIHTKLER